MKNGLIIIFLIISLTSLSNVHDIPFPKLEETLIIDDVTHLGILSQLDDSNNESYYPTMSYSKWCEFKSETGAQPSVFIDTNYVTFYKIGTIEKNNLITYVILVKLLSNNITYWTYHVLRYHDSEDYYYLNDILGFFTKYVWSKDLGNISGVLFKSGDYVSYNDCYQIKYFAFNDSSTMWNPNSVNIEETLQLKSKKIYNYNFLDFWNRENKEFEFDLTFYYSNNNYLPLDIFYNSITLNSELEDSVRSNDIKLDRIYLLNVIEINSQKQNILILVNRFNSCSSSPNASVYVVELNNGEFLTISEVSFLKPKITNNELTVYNILKTYHYAP